MSARQLVVVVGCGASKLATPATAEQLYTGSLTRSGIAYAQRVGAPRFILSAAYGLVPFGRGLDPYDTKLSMLRGDALDAWRFSVRCAAQLLADVHGPFALVALAGRRYVDELQRALPRAGLLVDPLAGQPMGQRLQWFAQRRNLTAEQLRSELQIYAAAIEGCESNPAAP